MFVLFIFVFYILCTYNRVYDVLYMESKTVYVIFFIKNKIVTKYND